MRGHVANKTVTKLYFVEKKIVIINIENDTFNYKSLQVSSKLQKQSEQKITTVIYIMTTHGVLRVDYDKLTHIIL